MKRTITAAPLIACAVLLIACALTACTQAKWSAPASSTELLQQFPAKFIADASGLKIERADLSTARTVIACHYFQTGENSSTIGLVYETYVPYERNRNNYQKLGRTIKQDQRIRGDHYLIISEPSGLLESICLSTGGGRYLRVYASYPKKTPAEQVIKIAAQIAAKVK